MVSVILNPFGILNSMNQKLLESFTVYCKQHPEERFWQALRNWAEVGFIFVNDDTTEIEGCTWRDTFYWENKNN